MVKTTVTAASFCSLIPLHSLYYTNQAKIKNKSWYRALQIKALTGASDITGKILTKIK